ncbi:hypothetical protein CDL15_Pgr002746 [Punica granatum]|uniref:SET domain-containing protein n=1 Tax=Punica granatum TaxID=22663 RepID=A0A218X1J1_PUNGR|nr:hypothetical protein CDL15_Pgr002746 [Punica granatum]
MAEAPKDELLQLIKRFGAYLTVKFSNLFSSPFSNLNSRSVGAIAGFAVAIIFTWRLLRSPSGSQRRIQKRQAPASSSSVVDAQTAAAVTPSGVSSTSLEDLRAQNVIDEFFQPVKPTLGQIVRQKLSEGRKVTCRLLGVILEENTPEELKKQATVRSSVLEVLLEITKFCDLYLMERVLDDESEKKVLLALEEAGVFTSGGLVKDKEYYDQLLESRQCHSIRVKQEGEFGKGVYANADFKEGELLLRDEMLFGCQHSSNKEFIRIMDVERKPSRVSPTITRDPIHPTEKTSLTRSFICLQLFHVRGDAKKLTTAETNDIFLLAAKAISFTILRYRKLKAARLSQRASLNISNSCDLSLLMEAWRPISVGHKKRWWECVALPEDVASSDEAAFRMQIKDLAFTEEAEKVTRPILDALRDEYAVICEGSAFFPLQSCMNHSCRPNAKAFKRDEDRDGRATIIAQIPIRCGDEVTISYIDEDLTFEERQAALADYGFICRCSKCQEEET